MPNVDIFLRGYLFGNHFSHSEFKLAIIFQDGCRRKILTINPKILLCE